MLQPPSRLFGDLGDIISQALASSAMDSLAATPESTAQPERSCKHSTDELARLYFEEGLSSNEVGKRCGISGGAVRARLRRAGYTLRSVAVPTDELARLYFDAELSSSEIAERVNLSAAEVLRRLRGTGRKMRTGSECHKLWQRQKRQKLTPEELQDCRLAPAYEPQHGIPNYVICRICGVFSKMPLTAETGHFAIHHPGMSKDEYRKLFPGAPLHSCLYTVKYTRMRDGRKLDLQTVMQQRAAAHETADELRQCRSNNDQEKERGIGDFVVCRECGKKAAYLAGGRGGHLRMHGWKNVEEYHRKWPGAPTVSPQVTAKHQKQWQAKRKKLDKAEQLEQAAKRRPVGRPPATPTKLTKKQELFIAAARLYDRLTSSNPSASWGMVAQQLAAQGYDVKKKADGGVANGEASRLRVGANHVREKFPQFFSAS